MKHPAAKREIRYSLYPHGHPACLSEHGLDGIRLMIQDEVHQAVQEQGQASCMLQLTLDDWYQIRAVLLLYAAMTPTSRQERMTMRNRLNWVRSMLDKSHIALATGE